jgi:hypothetical protein
MEGFQKIVLIAAIIILIICLIFIGISLSQQATKQQWPPLVPACPDYWTIDGSGNNAVCKNKKHLGNANTPYTMSLNDPNFATDCSKFTWATNYNLTWDGITYGVNNPCATT